MEEEGARQFSLLLWVAPNWIRQFGPLYYISSCVLCPCLFTLLELFLRHCMELWPHEWVIFPFIHIHSTLPRPKKDFFLKKYAQSEFRIKFCVPLKWRYLAHCSMFDIGWLYFHWLRIEIKVSVFSQKAKRDQRHAMCTIWKMNLWSSKGSIYSE